MSYEPKRTPRTIKRTAPCVGYPLPLGYSPRVSGPLGYLALRKQAFRADWHAAIRAAEARGAGR